MKNLVKPLLLIAAGLILLTTGLAFRSQEAKGKQEADNRKGGKGGPSGNPGPQAKLFQVVEQSDWDPADERQVANPHADRHPRFTSALSSPNLYWAESFRPYGDEKQQNQYYGRIRLGGGPKVAENPRLSYDPDKDAARQIFLKGERGMPHTYQTRVHWPIIGPKNASMVSVQWEYLIGKCGWRGGKQFQISGPKDRLHFEFNSYFGYGDLCQPGQWARTPVARTYSTTSVGGRGFGELLVGGSADPSSPDYCTGMRRCPPQPALPHRDPRKFVPEDHVVYDQQGRVVSGDAFLIGDETLSGWITVTVTFDWRDKEKHKVWMHLSDERTPKTLVIGIDTDGDGWGDDGYPLTYQNPDVKGFWLEFNNSKTINDSDSEVWVRNLLVFKDQFAPH